MMMIPNPFSSNPLTRNRQFPSVQFFSEDAAKNLQVPNSSSSYEEQLEAYRNLHVPQQSFVPEDPLAGFVLERDPTLAPDEWSHMRMISRSTTSEWGDSWGRDGIEKERRENEIFRKYNAIVANGNEKLSAELEKDDFRKQMLKDLEDGKIFQKTRLIIDESERREKTNA